MKGFALDRATILLLKLEYALVKDEKDERVGGWLEELQQCLAEVTGAVSPDEFSRLYKLNRKIWNAEDVLLWEATRMSVEPDRLVELGRLALEVRLWNLERSKIIASCNGVDDKVSSVPGKGDQHA